MERIKALAGRWGPTRAAFAVHERVVETNGGATASATTVMFFLAIFPLLLVGVAVVGFVAAGNDDLATDWIDQLGLQGQAADVITRAVDTAEGSRRAASIIGLLGLAWSGLGVTSALALAVRTPWQRKAKGIASRVVGLVWILGGVLTFVGAVGTGALIGRAPSVVPGPISTALLTVAGLGFEVAFFTWTFWVLGDRRTGWRPLVPGALVGAAGFEVLKLAGTVVLPRLVASSSSLYGPIGAVFALLAWLALFSRVIVYASAFNAVRWEAEHGTRTLAVQAIVFDDEDPQRADRGGAVVDAVASE